MTTVQELIDQLQALPDFQKRYRVGIEIDGAVEYRFDVGPKGGTVMIAGTETTIDRGQDEIDAAQDDANKAESQIVELEDKVEKLEKEIDDLNQEVDDLAKKVPRA